MKRCTKCGDEKPVSEFPRDRSRKDGMFPHCRICNRINVRAWVKANPDRAKESQRRCQAEWRKANPDKVSAKHKRWRDKNIDSERLRVSEYARKNPMVIRAIKHARRAAIKGAGGRFTAEQAIELRASYLGRCAYCFERPSEALDHVVPVARGGSSDIENMVPACWSCNSRKGSGSLLQFIMKRKAA